MNQFTVGKEYQLDPEVVEFNDEYVEFNPLHKNEEYEGTKLSIEEQGQLKPIYMLGGKCVDGRHRTRICKELGLQVKAIDLREDLEPSVVYDLCNVDTMAGRNLTPTQRAIAALVYKERLGGTNITIAKKFQVTKQAITYADALKNRYGQGEAVKELHKGNAVQLTNMDNPSKSLEYVCKKAKELHENSIVVEDVDSRIHFDPGAQIRTEKGKQWYYNFVELRNLDVESRMAIAELANYKFRVDEGE